MHARLAEADLFPSGPLMRLGRQVLLFDELESTNALLLTRSAELPDGAIALAEVQRAGRGRLGRRWESPRGASVLLSVLLREAGSSPLAARLTLVGVVAACEAIERATDCAPAVRWPNDVVSAARKLGGVLVESRSLGAGFAQERAFVLGIGINCLQQPGHFPDDLRTEATSLEIESAQPIDRRLVARALVERLDARLSSWSDDEDAAAALLTAWRARCSELGARVRLQQDRQEFSGTIVDIDERGDLTVQLDQGGRRHFASETTTRIR